MTETAEPQLAPRPPHQGGEKETLESFLDLQRSILIRKVSGLSEEEVRRSLVPSPLITLLSLVKHMAYVERHWFAMVLDGQALPDPWTPEDPDIDFKLGPEDTVESLVAFYRGEVARSRAVTAAHTLDSIARREGYDHSLRWILVHMIEETARHLGHADLIREMIDGQKGN